MFLKGTPKKGRKCEKGGATCVVYAAIDCEEEQAHVQAKESTSWGGGGW
jgi:hypothetical protein